VSQPVEKKKGGGGGDTGSPGEKKREGKKFHSLHASHSVGASARHYLVGEEGKKRELPASSQGKGGEERTKSGLLEKGGWPSAFALGGLKRGRKALIEEGKKRGRNIFVGRGGGGEVRG